MKDMKMGGMWGGEHQNYLEITGEKLKVSNPQILYIHVYPANKNNGT